MLPNKIRESAKSLLLKNFLIVITGTFKNTSLITALTYEPSLSLASKIDATIHQYACPSCETILSITILNLFLSGKDTLVFDIFPVFSINILPGPLTIIFVIEEPLKILKNAKSRNIIIKFFIKSFSNILRYREFLSFYYFDYFILFAVRFINIIFHFFQKHFLCIVSQFLIYVFICFACLKSLHLHHFYEVLFLKYPFTIEENFNDFTYDISISLAGLITHLRFLFAKL